MHLLVAVQRLLADAGGGAALELEPVGQLGDRALQAFRDGGELPLVLGDQGRVRLAGEPVRQVECTGNQGQLHRCRRFGQ